MLDSETIEVATVMVKFPFPWGTKIIVFPAQSIISSVQGAVNLEVEVGVLDQCIRQLYFYLSDTSALR